MNWHTTPVLDWLWQTTWQSALLALVVGMITWLFRRRLSPQAKQLLWMLVFVRLIMPALPGSALSIFGLMPTKINQPASGEWIPPISEVARGSVPELRGQRSEIRDPTSEVARSLLFSPARQPAAARPDSSHVLSHWLIAIWLSGAGLLMAQILLSTIRFSRRLKRTSQPGDSAILALVAECSALRHVRPPKILVTDLISTPAIMGAIYPCLLLPPQILAQLDPAALRAVILHELEHVRRHHLLLDWLLIAIRAVHWFNPAAWWSHRRIRAMRELICDQAVLASLDEENSRRYGETMLFMAVGLQGGPAGVPLAAFARDYKLLKQRIEAIASGKRKYLAGLGLLLAAILALTFLTGPQRATGQPRSSPATRPATVPAASQTAEDPANAAARALLDRVLPEIRFENQPLGDIVEFLRDVTGANIYVNWRALETAGVDRNTSISARLHNVTFAKTLDVILHDAAGAAAGKLKYAMDRGVITISTVEDLDKVDSRVRQPSTTSAVTNESDRLAELVRQSSLLSADGKFAEALEMINQILQLDPKNAYAKAIRPMVEDRAIVAQQRLFRDGAMPIPSTQTAQRDLRVAAERGQRAADAVMIGKLSRQLPEIKFENQPFNEVIEFLRDVSGANIFVNWRALEIAGIDKNAQVTERLHDVKFSKALETILHDVGGGTVRLGFTVDEGVLTISTEEDLAGNVVTNVYDVQDLIMNVTDFDGTQGGRGQQQQPQVTRQQLVDQIKQLIQDTVARESWRDNGGNIGAIRELSGQLIITQTPMNQAQIVRLLDQLREIRAIQIIIEARKLTLTHEQGDAVRKLAPTPMGSVQFLDEFQVSMLLRAAQIPQNVTMITAPRLTLFNGQHIKMPFGDGGVTQLELRGTASADRKYVSISLWASIVPQPTTQPVRVPNIAISPISISSSKSRPSTVTVPDGGSLLVMTQNDPDNGQESWLIIKPTIINQRAREGGQSATQP